MAWLTKEGTVLLQKDKSEGNIANNYRPITCLPLKWNFRSDFWAFRSLEVVNKRTEDAGKDTEELMIYFILIEQ